MDIEIKHSVATHPVKLDPWNKSENFSFHLTKGDIHDWKFNFSHPKIVSSKYYQRTLTVSFDGSNVIATIGSLKEKKKEVDNQFKLDQEEKCRTLKDAVTVRKSSAVVFGIYRGEVFTQNGTKFIDIGTTLHVHFKKLKKTFKPSFRSSIWWMVTELFLCEVGLSFVKCAERLDRNTSSSE